MIPSKPMTRGGTKAKACLTFDENFCNNDDHIINSGQAFHFLRLVFRFFSEKGMPFKIDMVEPS